MIKKRNVQKMYNLPGEILFCKNCTVSNQRPRIEFDSKGICSACKYAEVKYQQIDWKKREKELCELLKQYKRKDGYPEVLVPVSGGKDSVAVAHKLKYKYGMNVLTVTWSPHLYTEIGWSNFQSMIHIGGLDNILGTPNGIIHKKLTKLSLEILGDPFQPFIYGQTNFPLQIATKYNIPLIMYGENGEVEYGGDMKNAFNPMRDYKHDHKKHYFSGLGPEDMVNYGLRDKDLMAYLAPANDVLDKLKAEIHFYGYYKKWTPQENFYYCSEHNGFVANSVRSEGTYSKYASLDDKLDGFHYYLSYIKFGLGRATSDSAHEIRDGHITREEGVALVRRYDGEFPQKHFNEFLDYCDITEAKFWKIVDSFRSPHLWKKVKGGWELKHQVK